MPTLVSIRNWTRDNMGTIDSKRIIGTGNYKTRNSWQLQEGKVVGYGGEEMSAWRHVVIGPGGKKIPL